MRGATSFHAKWRFSMTSVGDFSTSLEPGKPNSDCSQDQKIDANWMPAPATNEDRFCSITL